MRAPWNGCDCGNSVFNEGFVPQHNQLILNSFWLIDVSGKLFGRGTFFCYLRTSSKPNGTGSVIDVYPSDRAQA